MSSGSTASAVLTAPIQFTVVTGNANWLAVFVNYTEHNATSSTNATYITPTSKLTGGTPLTAGTHGTFAIPVGTHGIPAGSTVNAMGFVQSANSNNCNKHTSNINNVSINGTFLGINTTAGSSCGTDCTTGGGGGGGGAAAAFEDSAD